MRRLAAALTLWAAPLSAETILSAEYSDPTTRYPHGILGDDEEWGNLHIEVGKKGGSESGLFNWQRSITYEIKLPDELVYEDVAPRLWDMTGDGDPEVVVVQSHRDLGARLLIIGLIDGKPDAIAATPFIGRSNRWLAPVGAADLDGDGHIEIAYVDRPHLAKVLRVWRYEDGAFYEYVELPGLTNHKIGEPDIGGGLRDCGGRPELIVASADWSQVMSGTLEGTTLTFRPIGPYENRASLDTALNC